MRNARPLQALNWRATSATVARLKRMSFGDHAVLRPMSVMVDKIRAIAMHAGQLPGVEVRDELMADCAVRKRPCILRVRPCLHPVRSRRRYHSCVGSRVFHAHAVCFRK
ncbi:hypothetical protein [Dyella sp. EPa41]|uniref:hypothetical protein n=1 Tax=Dyella sp. EPa41 TaxID=1561194 RepID=UPI001916C4AD|nr:hypothetical protein [Dyella sp. EPa41]